MEYNIQIAGFRSNIEDFRKLMSNINKMSKNCTVQLLNADGIAGREHITHAAVHAIKAFERNENIAKDLGLEICVRASAQRQISKALSILGLKEGKMNICAVAVDCSENIMDELEILLDKRDDSVLNPDEILLKDIYKISEEEIKTVSSISDVMIEKTTLLILET
ncbi:KEOPS complex subunit Cgi121 [Methanobacterium sp. MBAC-LM]|uniref:KEOPS complex subunit Cgi121 n=1 Tax=Methanobacterium sp. MBAC-LM TaxID=3412034 RepID=UPI003C76D8AD